MTGEHHNYQREFSNGVRETRERIITEKGIKDGKNVTLRGSTLHYKVNSIRQSDLRLKLSKVAGGFEHAYPEAVDRVW